MGYGQAGGSPIQIYSATPAPPEYWNPCPYTRTKSMVALQFDDANENDYSVVWPKLLNAQVPATFGVPAARPDSAGAVTWAQIKEMAKQGAEIYCHAYDMSGDDAFDSWDEFHKQVVTSLDVFVAHGMRPIGFVHPGPWYTHLWTSADWWGKYGELVRRYFPIIIVGKYKGGSAGNHGEYTPGPAPVPQRIGSYSYSSVSYADFASVFNVLQKSPKPVGMELVFHSSLLDEPDSLTTADFDSILADLVAARDAGQIDIVTLTGMRYNWDDLDSSFNYFTNESFDADDVPVGFTLNAQGSLVTDDSGNARTGDNYVKLSTDGATRGAVYLGHNGRVQLPATRCIETSFWIKALADGSHSDVTCNIYSVDNPTGYDRGSKAFTATTEYKRCRLHSVIPPAYDGGRISINITKRYLDGPDIAIDDVRVCLL